MKRLQNIAWITLASAVAFNAHADEVFHCAFGPQERIISVVYLQEGESLPCEVQYTKEGGTETLWSATSEENYCEQQAQDFVEQHRDWGWRCDAMPGEEPASQGADPSESAVTPGRLPADPSETE